MRQGKRSFVDTIDFRTSPGHSGDPAHDAARGWWGSGPTSVVTDLGTYTFDEATGEMTLATLHPGVTLEKVGESMGWQPKVAAELGETAPPTVGGAPPDPRRAGPGRGLHQVALVEHCLRAVP